jgi:hypothetical protein
MRSFHGSALLLVPVFSGVARGQQVPPPQQAPLEVRVPRDVPTIQQAVNLVADGGRVRVAAGRYLETVVVAGKSVDLRGAGDATRIDGASTQQAVLGFGPGGGGIVEHLRITGGAFGIAGARSGDALPAPLSVEHVRISDTGRGIYGSFSELHVDHAEVASTLANGLSILESPEGLVVEHTAVHDTGAIGILASAPDAAAGLGCAVGPTVSHSTVTDTEGVGLLVAGRTCSVTIEYSHFHVNTEAAIDLRNAGPTEIRDTRVSFARSVPGTDPDTGKEVALWGDGLRVFATLVHVSGLEADNNQGQGLRLFGCSNSGPFGAQLHLESSLLYCNLGSDYDIVLGARRVVGACPAGSDTLPELDDDFGNLCRTKCIGPTPAGVCRAYPLGGLAPVSTAAP